MRFERGLGMVGLALVLVVSGGSLLAGDLGFSWDASSGATGYRLHYGPGPGQYSTSVDVGNVTTTNVNTLADCTTQYYVVTAYNSAGESGYSNEVSSWPRPVTSGTSQSSAMRGDQLDLVLSGSNYQGGTGVGFSNPGITVNSVSIGSCSQLTVNITVGASAPLGPTDITVTGPNGVAGTSSGLFAIVAGQLPQVQNLRRTDVQ